MGTMSLAQASSICSLVFYLIGHLFLLLLDAALAGRVRVAVVYTTVEA